MAAVFHNPVWLMWPEILVICTSVLCTVGVVMIAPPTAKKAAPIRLLSFLGLTITLSMSITGVLSVSWLYTGLGILLIPAPLAFGLLLVRPMLLVRWVRLRVYLAACLIACALMSAVEFIWLSTR